jgi:hypothetical protein
MFMNKPGCFSLVVVVAMLLASSATSDAARESGEGTAPPVFQAQPSEPVVQLPQEVEDIRKLSRAKVPDDVIVAFVENSRPSVSLTAGEVIELRKQGVSDRVLAAMLKQSSSTPVAAPPALSPPFTPTQTPAEASKVTLVAEPPEPTPVAVPQYPAAPDPEAAVYTAPDAPPAGYDAYYGYPYYYPSYSYCGYPYPSYCG